MIVRFSESERYDINLDEQVVMFIATTGKGSYFAEIPVSKDLPEKRKFFQETAIECIQDGIEPGEITFA